MEKGWTVFGFRVPERRGGPNSGNKANNYGTQEICGTYSGGDAPQTIRSSCCYLLTEKQLEYGAFLLLRSATLSSFGHVPLYVVCRMN